MSKEWEDLPGRSVRRMGREEERVWAEFYRAAGDPAVAAELIAHMDQDEQARRQHSGLYLRCRQSLRREKERRQRAQAAGKALRKLAWALLGKPLAAFLRAGRFCCDAGAALFGLRDEPAAGQLRKLGKRAAPAVPTAPAEAKAQAGSDGR
ncbi:hypothetical protein [Massilia sp. Root351]|uniref:hypothetical protein n=1 Tax=Massilia sp. Root351 TaxID=1736522 RepID=UPI000A5E0909|nr:hypothetical protein [Massilia sp. Root351]